LNARAVREAVARTAEFYDEWTERFVAGFGTTLQAGFLKAEETAKEDAAVSACLLAARAGVRDGDRLLDAGCGVGGPAIAIADGHPGCTVDGVTVSTVQVALGRRAVVDRGLEPRISISRADYHYLPFANDSFDVALFLESCGYSPDRHALFGEATRVVRSGGRIYVKDVFALPGPLSRSQQNDLDRFDSMWRLARSPTIPDVEDCLVRAGCQIELSGALMNVGTARFVAAMVEPDPDTLFRLNELGENFLMRSEEMPLFFGEVRARVA
jgi:ubiquinone/menaquinone biosynthesis C-methylase UbiE